MTITAKVIADSISLDGKRIMSLQLRYPRFIHAEFMTHRVFSRNASSSRAIPVKRLIADVRRDMAEPIHWGRNQKGMQASQELAGWRKWLVRSLWRSSGHLACWFAGLMDWAGAHKQLVNRIIEPWSHITVLVTSTEWANFFELRDHPDAQPEIKTLARAIRTALAASAPQRLAKGEWHLPYIGKDDHLFAQLHASGIGDSTYKPILIRMSVARCARVSYMTHEGRPPKVEDDLRLYQQLVGSEPLHASPAEHQATPSDDPDAASGNFRGWVQYRQLLEHAT